MWRRARRWLGVSTGLTVALVIGTGQAASARECELITDFARNVDGRFPTDWKPKSKEARDVYRVQGEGRGRFVRGAAAGTGVQMGRAFEWDLATYPVLIWRWRPRVFPSGSDERHADRNDSVLGVYAVFRQGMGTVRTVKYVWSRSVPAGTTASASMGLTRIVVVRSGSQPEREWFGEAVNVARDYERLFGEAPGQPWGIALLTDADDTRSRAVGDYAAFSVCPPGTTAPEEAAG